MLTLQQLKDMKPGEMFASGTFKADRVNHEGNTTDYKWVACRDSESYPGWAIYYSHLKCEDVNVPIASNMLIKSHGMIVLDAQLIVDLVPADKEALREYRSRTL